jgi:alpha-1,4-digalacturonate transport system permease protein
MVLNILTARRSRGHLHITDVLAYGYLLLGILLMFGPALWLAASSFKTKAALQEFPPSALPLGQKEIHIPGRSEGLPAFRVTLPDGSTPELGLLRRIGLQGQFVDPKAPDGEVIRAMRAPCGRCDLPGRTTSSRCAASVSTDSSPTACSSRWCRRPSRC